MPQTTLSDTSVTQRLWFVDNLRVLLIALVIVHHLACIYSGLDAWYYTEQPTSGITGLILTVFVMVNQSWFMGAFFLLSGYFSPASYDRKGPRAFLRDRVIRLGIPLVVFYFVLNPILALGSGGSYLHTLGSGPLWFVLALLVMDTSYAVFRHVSHPRRRRSPRPLTFRAVIAFIPALALVTFALRIVIPMGVSVPIIDFPTSGYLPQYVGFFVLGTVAYRRGWLSVTPARLGKIGAGLVIGATLLFLPPALVAGPDAMLGHGTASSLFYAVWDSTVAVGMVLALLTLFRRRFNTAGPVRRYLSAHVFTVYVIHAVLVTAAGYALRGLELPSLVKLAIGVIVVLPACFLLAGPIRRLPGVRRVL